jgi:hypothetical protein
MQMQIEGRDIEAAAHQQFYGTFTVARRALDGAAAGLGGRGGGHGLGAGQGKRVNRAGWERSV